jgi:hypothetical protein
VEVDPTVDLDIDPAWRFSTRASGRAATSNVEVDDRVDVYVAGKVNARVKVDGKVEVNASRSECRRS